MVLEYKYLSANLFGLLPLCVAILLAGRLRNTAIVCGAVLSLFSPLAWLSERVYWTPERIFGGGFGIEDVIFCFHTGAMSWLCALWPWRDTIRISPVATVAIRRLAIVSLCAIIVLACLLGAGLTIMVAFTLTQTIVSAVLVIMRPAYIRLVLLGLPLFTAYYFLLLGLWKLLMPGFMGMWNGNELIGPQFLGVPLEEYIWVMSLSVGFPITMAFSLNAGWPLSFHPHAETKRRDLDA
jgi:hypothetical protein